MRTWKQLPFSSVTGFTLIELILVVILFAFASTSILFILNNQQLGNLEGDAEIVSNTLQEAQNRAAFALEGVPWGVHFDNATTTPFYAIFPGTTYSAPSSTRYLSGLVEFQAPASGTSTDIVFSRINGTVTTTVSIVIRLKTDTTKTKTVSVSTQGKITVTE